MFNPDDLPSLLTDSNPLIRDLAAYIEYQSAELNKLHAELSDCPPKALTDTLFHIKDRVNEEALTFLTNLREGMVECWVDDTDSDES